MSKLVNGVSFTFTLLFTVFLCSCNQNKPQEKITVVGENVDSLAISQDTTTQMAIEGSYEFAQSIVVSEKLVYDVIAYGGPPSTGEYAILRRGANNKADTVVRARRFGIMVTAFSADLNNNGKEEVYVVMRKANRGSSTYVSAFEFDKKGSPVSLIFGDSSKTFTINTPVPYDTLKPNADTIYADGNLHLLVKNYVYARGYSEKHDLNHAWRLEGNKFKIIHND